MIIRFKVMANQPVTREELDILINRARHAHDWSCVDNANVSKITNMNGLFYQVKGIKNLDLSKWDTSNVSDMSHMFKFSDFNSPLNFNTSSVKNVEYMFENSKYINL